MNTTFILVPIICIILYLLNRSIFDRTINLYMKKGGWFKVIWNLIYYILIFLLWLYFFVIFLVLINDIFWYVNLHWILILPFLGLTVSYLRFRKWILKLYFLTDSINFANVILLLSLMSTFYSQGWIANINNVILVRIFLTTLITILISQYLNYRLKWVIFLLLALVLFHTYMTIFTGI